MSITKQAESQDVNQVHSNQIKFDFRKSYQKLKPKDYCSFLNLSEISI